MAVEIGSAYLAIMPSMKGFGAKLNSQVTKESKGAGDKAGAAMGGGMLAAVGKFAGPMAAVFGGMEAVSFLKDSVGEAREAQKVGAVTAAVIKATGGVAKVSADQIGALATKISLKTGVDDEAIQSGQNLLLTFKNVRDEAGKGSDIFSRASQAAVDLSKAGFGSIEGSSKMLGKALNDPIKGMTMLTRSGVTFTDEQKRIVRAQVEGGDANALMAMGLVGSAKEFDLAIKRNGGNVMKTVDILTKDLNPAQKKTYDYYTEGNHTLDAQKTIMGEVEGQVGGVAEASATAGEKMSVAFGNFKEQVGTALLPVLDRLETFVTEKIVPSLSSFVTYLSTHAPAAFAKMKAVMAPVLSGLKGFFDFLTQHKDALGAIVTGIGAVVLAWKAYQAYLKIVTAVTKAYTAVQKALNFVMKMNPIGLVILAITGLVAGLIYAYKHSETFRAIVDKTFTWIKVNVPAALNAAKDGVVGAWNAIRGAFASAWNWVKGFFTSHWKLIAFILLGPVSLGFIAIATYWKQIKGAFWSAVSWVASTFKAAWSKLTGILKHPIQSAKDAIATILGKTGLQSVFSKAVTAVGKIWDGLKELAKKPIRFIVNTVLEDGLLAAFRWVSDKLGYDAGKNLHVSLPKGFSAGGWTGPGSKYTPAGIVHADEYVIKKESRRKIERDHPGLLDSLNGYANGGLVASPGDRGGFLTGGRQPVPGSGHRHSGYGWARWAGDFPVGLNTPVHAYKAGIVSAVRFLTTSYGKHVRINHAGEETLYAHLNSIGVKVGQHVAAGQVIGRSGSTGNSTGPHVHFELKGGNSPLSNTTGGDDGGGGFDFLGALKDRFAGPMNKLKEIGDSPFAQMVKAIPGKLKDALIDKATGAFGALAGAVGNFSNKADIASVLTNALIMNGLPLTQLDNWMRQVQTESGGNPNAVQGIQDVNSRSGNLAQGLLQVIPPTFAAYRSKLLPNNPFNALANAYAAMNYAKHRYGRNGIEGVIGHGHGYATGTSSASPGLHWVGERGPELMRFRGGERVYNASESAKIAGGGGRVLNVHGNVYGDDFEKRIFDEWDRRDRRARIRANFDSLAGFPG